MRLRIRLRVVMVVVALLALAMTYTLNLWRTGAFAFQREHAEIAREHASRRRHYSGQFRYSRMLAAAYPPGSTVPAGVSSNPNEAQAVIAKLEAKVREEEAIVNYHARIAGPSFRFWIDNGSSK